MPRVYASCVYINITRGRNIAASFGPVIKVAKFERRK